MPIPLDPQIAQLLMTIEEEAKPRFDNYDEYWNFYVGNHWQRTKYKTNPAAREKYANRWETGTPEPTEDVQANYCKTFIDKVTMFVAGKNFKMKYPQMREEVLKPVVMRILDDSDRDRFSMELLQIGGVTGDGYIFVGWDSDANFGAGGAVLEALDSGAVLPFYAWVSGKVRMVRCLLRYDIVLPDGTKDVEYQDWTRESVSIYRKTSEGAYAELTSTEDTRVGKNKLGEIPIVHIRNFPVSKDPFGRSDVEDIRLINQLYNKTLRQIDDVVDYHGAPITLVIGASIDELQKGENKTWALPAGADAKNLEQPDTGLYGDLEKILKTLMHIQGSIPENSVGQEQHISNTSGVALSIAYLPLTEAVTRKRVFYKKGIEAAVQMALRLEAIQNPARLPITKELLQSDARPFWFVEIVWQDFLPKDRKEELDMIDKEMELGLEDLRGALERLGTENVEQKIVELLAYREFMHAKKMEEQAEQFAQQQAYGIGYYPQ